MTLLPRPRLSPEDLPPVRVEYRAPDGRTIELARQPSRLRPLAALLRAEGARGELVVVDDETDRVLIRHRLGSPNPPAEEPLPPSA